MVGINVAFHSGRLDRSVGGNITADARTSWWSCSAPGDSEVQTRPVANGRLSAPRPGKRTLASVV